MLGADPGRVRVHTLLPLNESSSDQEPVGRGASSYHLLVVGPTLGVVVRRGEALGPILKARTNPAADWICRPVQLYQEKLSSRHRTRSDFR